MDSNITIDCRISATTFFYSSTVPWKARPISENFWSPIIDIEHALEINFMRRTKVKSIQLISACSVYVYLNDDTEWTLLKKFDSIDNYGNANFGAKFFSRIKIHHVTNFKDDANRDRNAEYGDAKRLLLIDAKGLP